MPAAGEKILNKSLSGKELKDIVLKDVDRVLTRDGLFSDNIAYARVAYEVRVTVHMDNPILPKHENTIASRNPARNETDPHKLALEESPLTEPTTDDSIIFSAETERKIASPNVARQEAGLPLKAQVRDMTSGLAKEVDVKYTGDMPDPASVGNTSNTKVTVDEQKADWLKKGRKK